ncbi:MAG: phenylacetate-CoA oxygenase subunit PaaC [Lewinellaceae bacterium]|nr:phenylacetate-CoA oxygenase subunit PaaC [Saprospiraceae bacterium]MCB9336991.1 phenylacetate-CoA oxygenase subunit PaaC [Lewinellaceae bacterium]
MLYNYLLQLGDNALILGHRLGEWCGHAPELEIDMALTNIALDLTGQARSLYQHAAEIEGKGRTEDDIAYLRDAWEFKNVLLAEQPNGDFAHTIARQFFYDTFNFFLHRELVGSRDEWLAGFAAKSLKEITYHLRFSSEWVLRLGDGTDTSHEKMQAAVEELWMYTGELKIPSKTDQEMAANGVGPDLNLLKASFDEKVADVLQKANLQMPSTTWMQGGGKDGVHSEHLGFILADMQYLQRAYPGQEW